MTLIAMDGLNFGSNLKFVGRLATIRLGLAERYRRWQQYRTTAAELRQYSDRELVELGIGRYDIEEVARGVVATRKNLVLTASTAQNLRRLK